MVYFILLICYHQKKTHLKIFFIMFNKTKIVATVGPASNSKEVIKSLVLAGVDVFRLNFSHGTHAAHKAVIDLIHEVNDELDTHVGILADLQGPKIRLGEVENNSIELVAGKTINITTIPQVSTAEQLYITYAEFAHDVKPGNRVLIDDGKFELKVISTNGIDTVKAKVIYGGIVSSKKGTNLPDTHVTAPSLTPKDIEDLRFILKERVHWVALSFVRTADDIQRLRGMLQFENNHTTKIIAKIERPEAIENIDKIIEATDGIMVARGDLGVEVPLEKVPIMQKMIVNKCISAAKPVIIATQMMESMMINPSPTRAEVTDVANAILDGADALMLSGETATGIHPVRVIDTFRAIINEVEKNGDIYSKYDKGHGPNPKSPTFLSDDICYNACRISDDIGAKAITGMTVSGYTAFMLSSFRPKSDIFIFTTNDHYLNSFSLIWGVRAFHYTSFTTTDDTMNDIQQILREKGFLKSGDRMVITASMPLVEQGRTNTIKISVVD